MRWRVATLHFETPTEPTTVGRWRYLFRLPIPPGLVAIDTADSAAYRHDALHGHDSSHLKCSTYFQMKLPQLLACQQNSWALAAYCLFGNLLGEGSQVCRSRCPLPQLYQCPPTYLTAPTDRLCSHPYNKNTKRNDEARLSRIINTLIGGLYSLQLRRCKKLVEKTLP